VAERHPAEVRHHDGPERADVEHLLDRDDVGVSQPGERLGPEGRPDLQGDPPPLSRCNARAYLLVFHKLQKYISSQP
jgi:hypothetical protein